MILAIHSPHRFERKLVFGRVYRSTADPVVGRALRIEVLPLEQLPAAGTVGFEVFRVVHISHVFQLQIIFVASTQLSHAAFSVFGLVEFDRAGRTARGDEILKAKELCT